MPSAKTFPSIYTHSVLDGGEVINLRLHIVLICMYQSIHGWYLRHFEQTHPLLPFEMTIMTAPFQSTFDYTLDAMALCCLCWPWTPGYEQSPGLAFSVAGTLHSNLIIHFCWLMLLHQNPTWKGTDIKEYGFSSVALFSLFLLPDKKSHGWWLNSSSKLHLLLVVELTCWLSGAAMV